MEVQSESFFSFLNLVFCFLMTVSSQHQFADHPTAEMEAISLAALHDRMTEQHYPDPIQSFSPQSIPAPLKGSIDILAEGRPALEKANQELGEQESVQEEGRVGRA